MDEAPTAMELRLVKSVEWLLFNQETWQTAVHQSNAVLRYMLGSSLRLACGSAANSVDGIQEWAVYMLPES